MIQRIQSLCLFMTALLSGLFLSGNFLKFVDDSSSPVTISFSGISGSAVTAGSDIFVTILSWAVIMVTLLSVLTIVLFKKRKLQLKITSFLIVLEILLILLFVYISVSIIKGSQVTPVIGLRMLIHPGVLIFLILAYRGIKKDEQIIRSYDRLR